MKDSWRRVTLYIILLPILLIIPLLITVFVDPNMNIDRYELMTQAIKEDLRAEGAAITDGVLTYETPFSATFDYFTIYVGTQTQDSRTINFVFEDSTLVMYMANVEFNRISYIDLNLLNHDFSSTDSTELRNINIALKVFFEQQSAIVWTDMLISYLFGLMDYLFIALLMSMMMLIFVTRVQFPFKMRFKLSVYLSTIWVLSELILSLLHAQELEFISILLAYVYHILAYRSMKVITKGAVK